MNKLKVPQLRFPGFDGEWNVKKVGELCDSIVPGRNKPTSFKGDIPWITTPDIEHNGIINYSKKGLNISREEAKKIGSRIVPINSIIISCVGELGLSAIAGKEIIINQQLHAFIPKERIEYRFLLYQLNLKKKYMDKVATKTAVPYMNKDNCNSIPIDFPTLPEQQKIASFLSAVDEKIQQLSRKKELLEQYKKGVMQQLFSGKLRFKDENGNEYPDWEFEKMNEIFSFKQGIQCAVESQFFEKSKNMERFIRIIDLTSDKEAPRFIANQDEGNIILEDDLFMVRYGVPGLVGYGYNGIIANNLFRLIPKKNICSKFYYYILTHLNKDIMNLSSSTTMPALNFSSLGALKIPSINIQEQQKIANFLSSIDAKIENTHGELEKIQLFKKGLLQKMFV